MSIAYLGVMRFRDEKPGMVTLEAAIPHSAKVR